jgi:hypothetical protein
MRSFFNMIKQYFLIILSIITITACNSSEGNKPDGLIDKKTFINILADIHSKEAEIFVSYPNQDTAYTVFKDAEREILASKKVKKADYDSTFSYYSKHPKEFDNIYASVIDTLSIREVKVK